MQRAKSHSNPKLSVIIPMYNCASVIARCLDSIDYQDCEMIIINDGSTDDGAEVVSEYRIKHPHVRLISTENAGVSAARNRGIEEARGDYLVFVDADDYLSQGGLARMIQLANEYHADVVKYKVNSLQCDAPCVYHSVAEYPMKVEVLTGKAQALKRYDRSDYHVVDAVFRTATIRDNGVHFNTDVHLHEDDVFMGAFYSVASQVVITDLPIYNYYTSSYFSHTHRQSIERQRMLINSGLLAIRYRKSFIQTHCPQEFFPYERLKYMRWVCSAREAVEAKLTYKEYRALLSEFGKEGIWPLDYQWIKIAGLDTSFIPYVKRLIRTFYMNHPRIGWPLEKLRHQIQAS